MARELHDNDQIDLEMLNFEEVQEKLGTNPNAWQRMCTLRALAARQQHATQS